MMGTMVSVHSSVMSSHRENESALTQKIATDEGVLQSIQLEKATRLAEAETEKGLADQHATAYNDNTKTLTEWAKAYQENRNQVHSLNG